MAGPFCPVRTRANRRIRGRCRRVTNDPGITWDSYFLYGPDATWTSQPAPLVSTGTTVYSTRAALASDFGRLEGKR